MGSEMIIFYNNGEGDQNNDVYINKKPFNKQAIILKGQLEKFEIRPIFTLTADGREFRCWKGAPSYVGEKHADSAGGKGLVFSIKGESEKVSEFVKIFVKEDSVSCDSIIKSKIILPNKSIIFGITVIF